MTNANEFALRVIETLLKVRTRSELWLYFSGESSGHNIEEGDEHDLVDMGLINDSHDLRIQFSISPLFDIEIVIYEKSIEFLMHSSERMNCTTYLPYREFDLMMTSDLEDEELILKKIHNLAATKNEQLLEDPAFADPMPQGVSHD